MTTIAQVRSQLATIATGITGWTGTAYVGDSVDAPMIKVSRPAYDPRMVLSGGKTVATFRCTAYVKRADTAVNEAALDALAEPSGSGSFVAAVQTSSNWGSVSVDYAQVVNVGETFLTAFGTDAGEYLACPFDVEVVW